MSSIPVGLTLLAAVVVTWPAGTARPFANRLRSSARAEAPAPAPAGIRSSAAGLLRWLRQTALRLSRDASRRRSALVGVATTTSAVGGIVAGWATGVAAGVVAVTGTQLTLRAFTDRHERLRFDGVIEAVAALTAELRAGQSVGAALAGVAGAAHPAAAGALRAAAASVALGGSASEAMVEHADSSAASPRPGRRRRTGGPLRRQEPGASTGSAGARSPSASALRRVAGAWQLCERSGASLADVLEAVESDLRTRRAHERLLAGLLSGPKATAVLLAGLPAFGLLMGSAMGADPWHVLTETSIGQIVLVVGVGLEALGLAWTARIVAGVRGA